MQKLEILCCLCLFISCNWFVSKEGKIQKLVDQEMQDINWNEIDKFPLFDNCDESRSKKRQRQCFEEMFILHFSLIINKFKFELNSDIDDIINVDFLIDRNGELSILNIEKNTKIKNQIPGFNAIIIQGFKELPAIAPALKRGIPVATKFRIPIVLNTK